MAIQIYDVNLHISIGKDVDTLYPPIESRETCSKRFLKSLAHKLFFRQYNYMAIND